MDQFHDPSSELVPNRSFTPEPTASPLLLEVYMNLMISWGRMPPHGPLSWTVGSSFSLKMVILSQAFLTRMLKGTVKLVSSNVYLRLDSAEFCYYCKTKLFIKRCMSSMSTIQLGYRLSNTAHSLHTGNCDRSTFVEQTKGEEGRHILASAPPICEVFVAGIKDIWEDIASQSEQFMSTNNFNRTLANCDMTYPGISCRLSQFLSAPNLSNRKRLHNADVPNKKLTSDVKYREVSGYCPVLPNPHV